MLGQPVAGQHRAEVGVVGARGAAGPAHPHADRAQQPRGGPPDRAGADHQRGLPGQRPGLLVLPEPFPLPVADLVQPLDPGQDRGQRELGHRAVEDAARVGDDHVGVDQLVEQQRVHPGRGARAPSAARRPGATRRAARRRRSPTAAARRRRRPRRPARPHRCNRSSARGPHRLQPRRPLPARPDQHGDDRRVIGGGHRPSVATRLIVNNLVGPAHWAGDRPGRHPAGHRRGGPARHGPGPRAVALDPAGRDAAGHPDPAGAARGHRRAGAAARRRRAGRRGRPGRGHPRPAGLRLPVHLGQLRARAGRRARAGGRDARQRHPGRGDQQRRPGARRCTGWARARSAVATPYDEQITALLAALPRPTPGSRSPAARSSAWPAPSRRCRRPRWPS